MKYKKLMATLFIGLRIGLIYASDQVENEEPYNEISASAVSQHSHYNEAYKQRLQSYENIVEKQQNAERSRAFYAKRKAASQMTKAQILALPENEQARVIKLGQQHEDYKKRKRDEINERNKALKKAVEMPEEQILALPEDEQADVRKSQEKYENKLKHVREYKADRKAKQKAASEMLLLSNVK